MRIPRTDLGCGITVIQAIAACMLVCGCIMPDEPAPPRASFSAPSMEARTLNNTTVWDCTFNITSLSPSNHHPGWGEVRVTVKSAEGGVLIPQTAPDPFPGPDLWTLAVYRIERAGGRLTMDVGDAVMLGAINGTYLEAAIELTEAGTLLAYARLPSVFP